ncbi:hypothetical protein JNK13_00235 [bacterium]|nr:hypothetical protein [bacterium]
MTRPILTTTCFVGFSSSLPLTASALQAFAQRTGAEESHVGIAYLSQPLVDSCVAYKLSGNSLEFTFDPRVHPQSRFVKDLPLWTEGILAGDALGLVMLRMDYKRGAPNRHAAAIRILRYREGYGYEVAEISIPESAFEFLKRSRVGSNLTAKRYSFKCSALGKQIHGEVLAVPLTGKVETSAASAEMQYALFVNLQLTEELRKVLPEEVDELRELLARQIGEVLDLSAHFIHLTTDPKGREIRVIAQGGLANYSSDHLEGDPQKLSA